VDLGSEFAAANASGIEFLKTELRLANTFLDRAETTKVHEHQLQSREDTLKAYRAVLKFLPRLLVSAEEKLDLDTQISALKKRMRLAGLEP
jgi:hypothetical protein